MAFQMPAFFGCIFFLYYLFLILHAYLPNKFQHTRVYLLRTIVHQDVQSCVLPQPYILADEAR